MITSKNDRNPDSRVNCPASPPLIAGALISVKLLLASVNVRPKIMDKHELTVLIKIEI